jgi:hypothetical protein
MFVFGISPIGEGEAFVFYLRSRNEFGLRILNSRPVSSTDIPDRCNVSACHGRCGKYSCGSDNVNEQFGEMLHPDTMENAIGAVLGSAVLSGAKGEARFLAHDPQLAGFLFPPVF